MRSKNKGMSGWGAGIGILSMLISVAIIPFLAKWMLTAYTTTAEQAGSLLDQARVIGGVKFLAAQVEVESPKDLRGFAVKVRDQLGSGVLLLATTAGPAAAGPSLRQTSARSARPSADSAVAPAAR